MVQTAYAPDDATQNIEQQWKYINQEEMMNTKLKCVFELPSEENEASEKPAGISPIQKVPVQTVPPSTQPNESELQKAAAEVTNTLFFS